MKTTQITQMLQEIEKIEELLNSIKKEKKQKKKFYYQTDNKSGEVNPSKHPEFEFAKKVLEDLENKNIGEKEKEPKKVVVYNDVTETHKEVTIEELFDIITHEKCILDTTINTLNELKNNEQNKKFLNEVVKKYQLENKIKDDIFMIDIINIKKELMDFYVELEEALEEVEKFEEIVNDFGDKDNININKSKQKILRLKKNTKDTLIKITDIQIKMSDKLDELPPLLKDVVYISDSIYDSDNFEIELMELLET